MGNVNVTINNTDALIADKLVRMQLTAIRKTQHLSQKDVSKISGLSESCISNIESGDNSSPTLRSLIKYATAIGAELYIGFSDSSKEENKNDNSNATK